MLELKKKIMLSNEEIADRLLSDIDAYKEFIKEIIVGRLMDSAHQRTYWDAWFQGAEGKDLEDAERGIIYTPRDGRTKTFKLNGLEFYATKCFDIAHATRTFLKNRCGVLESSMKEFDGEIPGDATRVFIGI